MAVWMSLFFFVCSVRLGVVVVGMLGIIVTSLALTHILIDDTDVYQKYFFDPIESNAELREQFVLDLIVTTFDKDANKFGQFLIATYVIYIATCILAIIGALRLYKWLLIPFIVVDFLRFIVLLSIHILLMIVLKKKLNLGVLIAATVAGGFVLLFIGYLWASVVAFFQILQVIETDRYKALYGSDPLHPRDPTNQGITNVRMYKTPNFDQITPLKNEKPTIARTQQMRPEKPRNLATIQLSNRDVQEFRNWYGHELAVVRKSNLIRFS